MASRMEGRGVPRKKRGENGCGCSGQGHTTLSTLYRWLGPMRSVQRKIGRFVDVTALLWGRTLCRLNGWTRPGSHKHERGARDVRWKLLKQGAFRREVHCRR
mmetsp:Transcript_2312/g.8351  ORF Transcript_2312/g.8351 Transcript_2312/m.8351 type:complete len:102 (+) Transcript_2312:582-887(+)